jgi:hypothetical protein
MGEGEMNFESRVTRQSKLPGVAFTVNKLTEGVRVALRLRLADALAQLRDIETEREEFFDSLAQAKGKPVEDILMRELTHRERRALQGFIDRAELINESEVYPAYFDAGFVAVDGIEIDGKKPDAETLRKSGPPALYREILAEILASAGITDEESENLGSPSTSGAEVDGKGPSTDAPSASGAEATSPAIVGGTSLSR